MDLEDLKEHVVNTVALLDAIAVRHPKRVDADLVRYLRNAIDNPMNLESLHDMIRPESEKDNKFTVRSA